MQPNATACRRWLPMGGRSTRCSDASDRVRHGLPRALFRPGKREAEGGGVMEWARLGHSGQALVGSGHELCRCSSASHRKHTIEGVARHLHGAQFSTAQQAPSLVLLPLDSRVTRRNASFWERLQKEPLQLTGPRLICRAPGRLAPCAHARALLDSPPFLCRLPQLARRPPNAPEENHRTHPAASARKPSCGCRSPWRSTPRTATARATHALRATLLPVGLDESDADQSIGQPLHGTVAPVRRCAGRVGRDHRERERGYRARGTGDAE